MLSLDFGRSTTAGDPRRTGRAATRPIGRGSSVSSLRDYDLPLLWAVLVLMLFGLVMVYSASIALPDSARFSSLRTTHHLWRHSFSVCVGLTCGLIAFAIPIQRWQRASPWLFGIGLILLTLVLVPGIGKVVLGARRWISLGFINLQPSELMKLFVVLYAADYAVRKQDAMRSFRRGFAPMAVCMALIGLLLLLEPGTGSVQEQAAPALP